MLITMLLRSMRMGWLKFRISDSRQPTQFQLSIADINKPNLLEKVGANRFQLPGTEAEQIANGTLRVG